MSDYINETKKMKIMSKLILVFFAIRLISCNQAKEDSSGFNASAQRTPCVDSVPGSPQQITSEFNAQEDIIPESEIIDCSMIPIGSPDVPGYEIWRNPNFLYKGKHSYYFKMESDKEKRVELQSLYVTQADINGAGLTAQEVVDYQSTKSLYHFGKGEAQKGETWTYEYGLYLPASLSNKTGIITQWHGMPDRTTIVTPSGDTVYYEHADFMDKVASQMYFNKHIGYNKSDNKPNGYYRDYGGNPPMALRVKNGYLYLICRTDHLRVTDPDERTHIYPPNMPSFATSPEGNKEIFGVWSKLLSELPVEEWIDIKFEVTWSRWAEDGSGIIDDGNIKLYLDGVLMADWTGPIGNNDRHGTYFKYGLYVPGPNGLEVRLAGFNQYQGTVYTK